MKRDEIKRNIMDIILPLYICIFACVITYRVAIHSNAAPEVIKSEIIFVESCNEMIPEEFIDDYIVTVKTGNLIEEFQFDIETKKLTEISSYPVE